VASPRLAGTVILISKIYDSITDPFEGLIADRTRTRFGRRRPYLIAGVPLIFLSFMALFFPFSMESNHPLCGSGDQLPVFLHSGQHCHAQLQRFTFGDHS
jgi:MFS family permease